MRRYTVDSVLFTQPRKRKHNKKNAASPSSSPSPRQLGASSTIWLYNVSLATRSWVKQCSAQANIGSALTSLLEDNPGSQTEIHHLNTPCLLHVIKAWQSETKTQGCQKIQTKTDMEVFIVFFFLQQTAAWFHCQVFLSAGCMSADFPLALLTKLTQKSAFSIKTIITVLH